jgi:hypothetical protein
LENASRRTGSSPANRAANGAKSICFWKSSSVTPRVTASRARSSVNAISSRTMATYA